MLTRPDRSTEPRCEVNPSISTNRRALAHLRSRPNQGPLRTRHGDRRWEGLSGACDSARLAPCQALPCHDLGGASRGRTGSQGSPVRGARSAGRRPDLDGPSARATIAPGCGRGASDGCGGRPHQFRSRGLGCRACSADGGTRRQRLAPCGQLEKVISAGIFVVQTAKMSQVVRGRPARCPEMRLTCSGWWRMVLAMAVTAGRSKGCVVLNERRRGLTRTEEMTAGRVAGLLRATGPNGNCSSPPPRSPETWRTLATAAAWRRVALAPQTRSHAGR